MVLALSKANNIFFQYAISEDSDIHEYYSILKIPGILKME